MSKYDNLRKAAGISPVASSPSKGATIGKSRNYSTTSVSEAPTLPVSIPRAENFDRPVRPTQILPKLNYDIAQSTLLKQVAANPVPHTPVQDVIARGASSVAKLPGIKQTLSGLGKAIEFVEGLPVINEIGGSLTNSYNMLADKPTSTLKSQANKNIADLIGGKSGNEPLLRGLRTIVEGARNPEEAKAREAELIARDTEGMGPVAKFGKSALIQTATDPLSLIPNALPTFSGASKGISRLRELAAARKPVQAADDVLRGVNDVNARGLAENDAMLKSSPISEPPAPVSPVQQLRDLSAKRGPQTQDGSLDEALEAMRQAGRDNEALRAQRELDNPTPRVEERPLTADSTPEEILQAVQRPRVRDRVYNFLDEQEQAAQARRKGRRNYLSANPLPEYGDLAIIGAARMGKGTIKAADWTEEMVKEFGEGFRQQAPKVYQQSKEILRQQERKASKEGQAADAFNAGAGDASSFENKINRSVNNRKKSWSQIAEQARKQFTDRRAALEGLEKRVKGKVGDASESLYKASRLFAGVSEKANQIITDRLTPIIKAVEDAKFTADDLGRYALAKHAKDVNEAGYKSGFTNAEIDDVIRKYENAPGMEEARLKLIQVNKDMLDDLVKSGVTPAALRDTLNERWKNYVPLFRSFEDDPETFAQGLGQSLKSIGDPIKSLKGSERKVIDPLENMVKNIYQSVTAAERNKVKLHLSNLAKADPDGNYIRKLADHNVIVTKDGKPVKVDISPEEYSTLANMSKEQKDAFAQNISKYPNSKFARALSEKEHAGRKNVVPVRENGETVRYEVEPEVYKAFAGLDDEASNMLMNFLAAPASWLRAGATLTPEFAARNPIRDVVQAYVTSKSGFNPFVDFPIGLMQTITKGKYYKEWIDNLGAYGNTLSMDRNMHKEALETVLKQPASKKFVNVLTGKSVIKLLRTISDTTESATKVGEYRKAIKKGQTPQEAAYRSRDLMDFARAGTSVKPANRIISFLNANIQGKSKLLRAIKENPVKTTTKMITGVTLPTIGIYAWNHKNANEVQRQTMDEAPDWQKDAFWMIAVPGTDTVARIPKPFDIAPLFANLPERILDHINRNNPVEMGKWIQNSLKESALPYQISGLLPLIEGMTDYSFFRQGDVVPEREKGLELKDQYDPIRTPEIAKLLAAGVRKINGGEGTFKNFGSPRIMDNTIKGYTAGLGTYVTDATDAILQGKVPYTNLKIGPSLIDRPTSPEKRIEQQPLARSFLVDPLGSTKSMDQMYKEKEKLSRQESSNQLNEKELTTLGKKKVYLPLEKAERLDKLDNVTKYISEINKEIRAIEKDKLKSAIQKRNEIDPLLAKRNKLSIEVMRRK